MKPITKRFLESFIVVVLITAGAILWIDKQTKPQNTIPYKDIISTLHQAIWEKYGPGSQSAYLNLFPEPRKNNAPSYSPDDNLLYYSSLPYNHQCGFLWVEEAPLTYRTKMEFFDNLASSLHKALESGPFLASPEEIKSRSFGNVDFSLIRSYSYGFRLVAQRDWMLGNHQQALERLSDIVRLAQAFRFGIDLFQHLQRNTLFHTGLDAFNALIWSNPSAEDNRIILKTLLDWQSDSWSIPSFAGNTILNLIGINDAEQYAAFRVLTGIPNPEVQDIFKQIGIESGNEKMLSKWTTLPALYRRLDKLPDTFFSHDPLLTPEQAKQIPRLYYALSQTSGEFIFRANKQNKSFVEVMNASLEKTKRQIVALESAFWVRQWRDEHGSWPTQEEFNTHSPGKTQFSLIKTTDPEIMKYGYQSVLNINYDNHTNQYYHWVPDPNPYTISYQFTKTNVDPNYPSPSELDQIKWTMGIFRASSPLINSVTYEVTKIMEGMMGDYTENSGMGMMMGGLNQPTFILKYTLQTNRPQASYWILETPIEDEFPESFLETRLKHEAMGRQGSLLDDSFNELGTIIQLAGWE